MNKLRDSKGLYWGLIATFFLLYVCVGFVSTLHSITFFELANSMWLAVLLGITYEVGQATVLFSILMSKNSNNILPWGLMILLTALQVTANVYASFKFMDGSGSLDWTFWQRSILFWLDADGPEMFKVVISWISGALLPVVALGMTALVADNLKLKDGDEDNEEELTTDEKAELLRFRGIDALRKAKQSYEDNIEIDASIGEVVSNEEHKESPDKSKPLSKHKARLHDLKDTLVENTVLYPSNKEANPTILPSGVMELEPAVEINLKSQEEANQEYAELLNYDASVKQSFDDKFGTIITKGDLLANSSPEEKVPIIDTSASVLDEPKKVPNVRVRGWHLNKEYIDNNGDVYSFGVFQPKLVWENPVVPEEPKKAKE